MHKKLLLISITVVLYYTCVFFLLNFVFFLGFFFYIFINRKHNFDCIINYEIFHKISQLRKNSYDFCQYLCKLYPCFKNFMKN